MTKNLITSFAPNLHLRSNWPQLALLVLLYLTSELVVANNTHVLAFNTNHSQISELNEPVRIQNMVFPHFFNLVNLQIEEGFFVKDTHMQNEWKQVGGTGKFHPSTNQDPENSQTLLMTNALKLSGKNNNAFRFCSVNIATHRAIAQPSKVTVRFLQQNTGWVSGEFISYLEWQTKEIKIAPQGGFTHLNLSSRGVYEVVLSASSEDDKPLIMIIEQINLAREHEVCGE